MKLAPQLVIAFGVVATVSTVGLGGFIREGRRTEETSRFDAEVKRACDLIGDEVKRQADSDRKLVSGACRSGELVDRTLVAIEANEIDERRLALAALVPAEREAFDLDELALVTNTGEVLGGDPRTLLGMPTAEVTSLARDDAANFLHGSSSITGMVSRCRKSGISGHAVSLVGARDLSALLKRLGKTAGVDVAVGSPELSTSAVARASCDIRDAGGNALSITVGKSKAPLDHALAQIDQTVMLATLISIAGALFIAMILARSLGRPIAELAQEAGKVATGEARPLRVRGSNEVADLVAAFDRMIEDLDGTRRRLAAVSRVAAWREVARRVAHEVKNPLAPIRAAVETLRRLRARNDPAFDEYFDEATRTVLEEVHRIANIVTEFTRFARLPPPRPEPTDLSALVNQVVTLQKANAKDVSIEIIEKKSLSSTSCDREQIIQVLTNLIQNALEATVPKGDRGKVTVTLSQENDRARIEVADNGPGVASEMAERLFEPYATNKPSGTGLGLAIAQRIAIDHGGELSHVARASSGAVFRLVLPIEGPPPVSEMPASG
jgi:two-component system, NtrC family, nitrogen regulation sensor histidine kinase NtrY